MTMILVRSNNSSAKHRRSLAKTQICVLTSTLERSKNAIGAPFYEIQKARCPPQEESVSSCNSGRGPVVISIVILPTIVADIIR
jgi:hypothetical protein